MPSVRSGNNATFQYYGFALDAVTWASPSLQAPATMTLQNLRDIYNCVITNWTQLPGGGRADPAVRYADRIGHPLVLVSNGDSARQRDRSPLPASKDSLG